MVSEAVVSFPTTMFLDGKKNFCIRLEKLTHHEISALLSILSKAYEFQQYNEPICLQMQLPARKNRSFARAHEWAREKNIQIEFGNFAFFVDVKLIKIVNYGQLERIPEFLNEMRELSYVL